MCVLSIKVNICSVINLKAVRFYLESRLYSSSKVVGIPRRMCTCIYDGSSFVSFKDIRIQKSIVTSTVQGY